MAIRPSPRRPTAGADPVDPGLGEALAVWALLGAVAVGILTTHGRRPELPHSRPGRGGLASGVGQALVFVRHPLTVAAAPLAALALERLPSGAAGPALARSAVASAVAQALTKRVAARRGVDVRPGDGPAVAGVVAALALTTEAVRVAGIGGTAPWSAGDRARLGLAAGILVPALPWVFADVGVYVGDVPVIGAPVLSHGAVHLGHHHGMDGALLALTALALSRQLSQMRTPVRREGLSLALALLLAYGIERAAQDAWHEQVFKRGWTRVVLPEVVRGGRPIATPAWSVLLLAAAAFDALFRHWARTGAMATSSPANRRPVAGPSVRQRFRRLGSCGKPRPVSSRSRPPWVRPASPATR